MASLLALIRGGRREARVFAAVPRLVLTTFVVLAGFIGVATALLASGVLDEAEDADAVLPPIASIAVSGMLTVAFLAGIALILGGLAALADPRSEQHLRRR